ncbi:MAG TPA: ATP-dependent Clp protease ATP-binding subunit [Patescibacteria group bacterium]|nr:ATP-dependent Clp protease ATP-binding subunit [Patescibacteria group bacterium]
MPNYLFNPEKSKIFQTAKIEKLYHQFYIKIIQVLVWVLMFLGIVIWILNLLELYEFNNRILGLALAIISTGVFLIILDSYFNFLFKFSNSNLAKIKSMESVNWADFIDLEVAQIVNAAEKIASKAKNHNLTTLGIFLGSLKNRKISYLLARAGINLKNFQNEFQASVAYSQSSEMENKSHILSLWLEAANFAISQRHTRIQVGDLFYALTKTEAFLQKIMFTLDLKIEDMANLVHWQNLVFQRFENQRRFFSPDYFEKTGGIGREWSYGYTPNLNLISFDITSQIQKTGSNLHMVGHQLEIEEMERILSRSGKNNILLVGEPGVGKNTIVLGFAKRICQNRALKSLRYKKIFKLDMGRLLAGEPAEIEAKLVTALNEAVAAGDIILFIENIETLFGGGESKIGAIDASEILAPYLGSTALQLIGTCSYRDYHQFVEAKPIIAGGFEKIEVAEPNEITTIKILEEVTPFIEGQYQIFTSYQALREIVKLAKRYLTDKPFPEKAIDLLDEVAVYVSSKTTDKLVQPVHVQKIVADKTKIPTEQVQAAEKEKLLNLEQFLHQRVIGQNEAVKAISEAMRRARTGLKSEKKPIGSFLFLGPTGVGKTETAKALAESFFGSENSMSRLDMSEFKMHEALDRLVGTPNSGEGVLTAKIKENPYCLLLLDEIEKAHPDVLNLFLQVLDEGQLTDRLGRKVNFTNTIIIATSNAGAELIRENIKVRTDPSVLKEKLLEYLQHGGIFRPEFLNRFDDVISFKPLEISEIQQVCQLILVKLAKRLKDEKEIVLGVAPDAVAKLAQLGYDPEMGARPMQRVIADKVENWLAERLLRGEIIKGQKVIFRLNDIA